MPFLNLYVLRLVANTVTAGVSNIDSAASRTTATACPVTWVVRTQRAIVNGTLALVRINMQALNFKLATGFMGDSLQSLTIKLVLICHIFIIGVATNDSANDRTNDRTNRSFTSRLTQCITTSTTGNAAHCRAG